MKVYSKREEQEKTSSITKNLFSNIGIGKERNYLVENLSILVAGGVTITSAIDIVSKEMYSRRMKKVLNLLRDDVESGTPLWRAFKNSGLFGDHTISLIRLGEESGKLSDNLQLIAAQEDKNRILRSKINSAMMYPVFVMSLTLIVGVAIAWFILPRLSSVFSQLRIDLPVITQLLIGAGGFIGNYGLVVFPIFLFLIITFVYFIFYFPKTRFIGQFVLFSIPGIKKLMQEVELARFGYLLGTLLKAGLPIDQAFESLYSSTFFYQYKKFYFHLQENIQEGNSFSTSFSSYKKTSSLIPLTTQHLIIIGEQSGSLAETLLKISAMFDLRTENTTKNITIIIEPILLVIVWLGVVAVALAVILPIYNLIGGLNSGTSGSTQQNIQIENPSIIIFTDDNSLSTTTPNVTSLEILSTGVGYLNVRDEASILGNIIIRVLPGETYEYINEDNGWYEIILGDNNTGWVFGDYVRII